MTLPAPSPTPFELLGGDAGVRRLVDRFYDLVDSAPEARTIRALHATSLKASRDKLHLYLTTWTGGPPVYTERHNSQGQSEIVRLNKRYLYEPATTFFDRLTFHFSIGQAF